MTEPAPRMNVESFNLDHRTVAAPYLRIADRKELPGGDVLTKFDVRFTQPNLSHLDSETVHSLEHLMAELLRDHTADVLDVSPMGCRTGFYVLLFGDHTAEGFAPVLEAGLRDLLEAAEVPAANEVQCGWGAHHSLEGAQRAAREFLAQRDQWEQVTAG
ncbi:S-ribosylhomocysteine lyase [Brachybacterium sp. YJGR34]|uniref:S-ribosylhomocysteine lyase n=1 Tax=Brachybacterium sp. YJGR34 TaxID=2059911 RepID=UPI000E09E9D8|nr:S-ribosylhomocysteine lyase [Brachybacterium sp. YJGR34]